MQQTLFFDGIEEAAQELGRHYVDPRDEKARGPKALAQRLRPNKSPSAAHTWWLDCCNPNRTEHNFTGEDWLALIKIGREIGCHAVINLICDDASYQRPAPIDPEDERDALQRAFIESVKEQKRMLERIERADQRALMQAVDGGRR